MRIALLAALVVAWLFPVSAAAAENPWLTERVLNIAHQGGEDEFPSNTLYAFKRSVAVGADMLVTNTANVARAHADGFAGHTWLSDDGESPATWRRLIGWCVDGVMTARPVAFERVLRGHPRPETCR